MNEISRFVHSAGLEPADVVVVKQKSFRLIDHYIVYLGKNTFIANYKGHGKNTVSVIPEAELLEFMDGFEFSHVRSFRGTSWERRQAVERALSAQNLTNYQFFLNNCEHFANYVQDDVSYSRQTQNLGGAMILGGSAALCSKSKGVQGFGVLLFILGLLALILESASRKNFENRGLVGYSY